ncbi:MAG TPA: SLC45 family MFS transporter [Clostridiaceae bacterium]|nr:SLC45 family MFS transporter [Clostridiaceae bacterium]
MSQSAGKLDYRKTMYLGFGFLASSLAWSIYNSLVPVLLEERFMLSTVVIGTIMTIDNIFGIIFQPLVGAFSDKTFTRYGRRMPWIMVGIPLSAIFFALIPWAKSLGLMMGFLIAFNLIMSMWRSPVIALMPDLTPRQLRSKANGIINLMGGVGSIIAFLAGGILANMDNTGRLTFGMGSAIMVIALVLLVFFIREPVADAWRRAQLESVGRRLTSREFQANLAAEEEFSAIKDKGGLDRKLSSAEKRSLVSLLGAIFFWFCAYNAIETFFTLFATNVLNVSTGTATIMLTSFSLTFVAFALPAGLIAGKRGRKKTIITGLFLLIGFMLPMIFINPILSAVGVDITSASSLLVKQIVVIALLACAGFGWACVNINSLPMVVELASHDKIGRFTGYYYFFSFGASIASPILFGAIRDWTRDYNTLFIYAVICFSLALLCTLFVKHGEAQPHDPEVMAEALLDLD